MIEMYHREHARVHPCAAEESELERLLAQGWVRTKEELDQPTRTTQMLVDEFDQRVDAMLLREEQEEKRQQRRLRAVGGSSTPEI
jgi:hypothetical protein